MAVAVRVIFFQCLLLAVIGHGKFPNIMRDSIKGSLHISAGWQTQDRYPLCILVLEFCLAFLVILGSSWVVPGWLNCHYVVGNVRCGYSCGIVIASASLHHGSLWMDDFVLLCLLHRDIRVFGHGTSLDILAGW